MGDLRIQYLDTRGGQALRFSAEPRGIHRVDRFTFTAVGPRHVEVFHERGGNARVLIKSGGQSETIILQHGEHAGNDSLMSAGISIQHEA